MASICRLQNGTRAIQFTKDAQRKTIRLGKVTKRQADSIRSKVEHLLSAKLLGNAPDSETSKWLRDLDGKIYDRLVRADLVPPRENKATQLTLKEFLHQFIEDNKPRVKPDTITTWTQTRRLLLEKFPADMLLTSFTTGHAIQWQNYLSSRAGMRVKNKTIKKNLSESTICRRCGCAKQIFDYAVDLRLIDRNPFASKRIKTAQPRPEQKRFVTVAESKRILEELPDSQWRLLFVLIRWGGLRAPSEPSRLTWSDVDWKRMRLTVHSPKTEHHEGHDKRVIPIFPEIAEYLQEVWDAAEPGEDRILPMMRGKSNSWLRKPLIRAIRGAGLTPWDKLCTSLRATRDTELRETYPGHVVEAWIGHNAAIAKKNYLQVTDEHFERARRKEALQNALQHPAAVARTDMQIETATPKEPRELPFIAAQCEVVHNQQVGDTGFEPVTSAM